MARPGKPNVRRAPHGETVGYRTTTEYRIWQQMIARCRNPRHPRYADYGGRGIDVCDRWFQSLEAFIQDMGRRPSAAHSLDRKDNSFGYAPDNCRWATRTEQSRNRRNNLLVTREEETLPLSVWADRLGLPYSTIRRRIRVLGWSAEEALSTPVGAADPARRRLANDRLQRNQAAVLAALAAAPGQRMSQADIQRLGCDPKKLRKRGLVRKIGASKLAPLELTPLGARMLSDARLHVAGGRVTVQ